MLERLAQEQLKWNCRRGLLELDIVLERMLRTKLDGLNEKALAELEVLLELPDNDLWDIVKGKSEPIHVYEPLTGTRADDANTKCYLAAFELMKYADAGALAAFEEHCQRYPDDALAQYHIERLREGETGEVFAMAEK